MIDAAEALLALLNKSPGADDRHIVALARALDELAHSYHLLSDMEPEDGSEPPNLTPYERMYEMVLSAFPKFGFYPDVCPNAALLSPTTAGDAVDDLADIALEMEKVKWRWENNGPQDAIWHFRFGYRSHWGRHLHGLRSYCHCLLFHN